MEGTCFESDWAAVAAGTSALRALLGRLHQAGSDRLGPMFAELDELKLLAEAGQVAVLGEGLSRGDVRESDAASPAGWVRHWGHSYPPAVRPPWCRSLWRSPRSATGCCARRCSRPGRRSETPRSRSARWTSSGRRLTPECHDTVLEGFVALAEGQGPRRSGRCAPH